MIKFQIGTNYLRLYIAYYFEEQNAKGMLNKGCIVGVKNVIAGHVYFRQFYHPMKIKCQQSGTYNLKAIQIISQVSQAT